MKIYLDPANKKRISKLQAVDIVISMGVMLTKETMTLREVLKRYPKECKLLKVK